MNTKPKCGHKPDPGYRELFGEERENHISAMEKFGYVSRRRYVGARRRDLKGTCLHIYVKDTQSLVRTSEK